MSLPKQIAGSAGILGATVSTPIIIEGDGADSGIGILKGRKLHKMSQFM